MGRPAKPLTNKSGVYLLKVGDAHYVGSSKRLAKRIFEHERLLKAGSHTNKELQEAYNQYQSILHEVLEFLPPDKEALLEAEQTYYDSMRSRVRLVNAGDHAYCWKKGKPVSEEMKQRISTTIKESGVCKGENNPFFGKRHTAETIEHLREVHRNHIPSDSAKEKTRIFFKGRKLGSETVRKRQESRGRGGKAYIEWGDFVAFDKNRVEILRFSCIQDFVDAGFSKGAVYKSLKNKTPYRGMVWEKDTAAPGSGRYKNRSPLGPSKRRPSSHDLVGYSLEGCEVVRFRSVKEMESNGYPSKRVYPSMKKGVPYRKIIWRKEAATEPKEVLDVPNPG